MIFLMDATHHDTSLVMAQTYYSHISVISQSYLVIWPCHRNVTDQKSQISAKIQN